LEELNTLDSITFKLASPDASINDKYPIVPRINNLVEIKLSSTGIQNYKFVSDDFLENIIDNCNIILNIEYKFTSENINKYVLDNNNCEHFDELNNYIIDESVIHKYVPINIISLQKFLLLHFFKLIYTIIDNTREYCRYYKTYLDTNNYVYIEPINSPPDNTRKDLKIHLMFHTKYHILILIMLMKIFKNKDIHYRIKTNLSYYSSTISPPYNDNTLKKWIYKLNYRGPLIVIYCNNIDGFKNIMKALLEGFDGLFHILGNNLIPSFNIQINELLYYSIGARYNKTDIIDDVLSNCSEYNNYSRFSYPGIEKWDNCSNHSDTEEDCNRYSTDPKNTRLTYGEPMCIFAEDKCIPKPLSTCLIKKIIDKKTRKTKNENVYINNKEEYDIHKNKCVDPLCMQELQFNYYSRIKDTQEENEEEIGSHPDIQAEYDPQFVKDIEYELNIILHDFEREKKIKEVSVKAQEVLVKEVSVKAQKANSNKYMKYKLKYLKYKTNK
jgi:hypothetical protein